MNKNNFTAEQIIFLVGQVERGEKSINALCRELHIAESTFLRWRSEIQAQRIEELEVENNKLKRSAEQNIETRTLNLNKNETQVIDKKIKDQNLFKPYLDILMKDDDRVRASIYSLLVAILFTLGCFITVVLHHWPDTRATNLWRAIECFQKNDTSLKCHKAEEYAYHFTFADEKSTGNPTAFRSTPFLLAIYNEEATTLKKSAIDRLTIQIPILGLVIDERDIGTMSAAACLIILIIVYINILRQARNIGRSKEIIIETESTHVLLMSQTFAALSRDNTRLSWFACLPFLSTIITNMFFIFHYWELLHEKILQMNSSNSWISFYIELICCLFIVILSVYSFLALRSLAKVLDEFSSKTSREIELKHVLEKHMERITNG